MKFIFVSHGDLAKSMLGSAQMIVGEQADAVAFGLYPKDDIEKLKEQVEEAIKEFGGDEEIICFTDLFSGSPFNSVVAMMGKYSIKHITGMNLPLILEAFMMRSNAANTIEEVSTRLLSLAPKTVVDVNHYLAETMEEE